MLTRLRRKPASAPRIAVDDVAAELGLPSIQPHIFGFAVDSQDTLSEADANALIEAVLAARNEHNRAWSAYLRSCRAWEDNRAGAYRNAAASKVAECRRDGTAPGPTQQQAREAGRDAARAYEETVPRPAWNGEAGYGGHCRLEYADERNVAPADAGGAL